MLVVDGEEGSKDCSVPCKKVTLLVSSFMPFQRGPFSVLPKAEAWPAVNASRINISTGSSSITSWTKCNSTVEVTRPIPAPTSRARNLWVGADEALRERGLIAEGTVLNSGRRCSRNWRDPSASTRGSDFVYENDLSQCGDGEIGLTVPQSQIHLINYSVNVN